MTTGAGGGGGAKNLPELPELPQNGDGGEGGGGHGDGDGPGPVAACSEHVVPDLDFSKANLLASIAACTELRLCEFEIATSALKTRANEYATEPSPEGKDDVQSAFFSAILRAAVLDLFQFGPQASALKDPVAGQGLRDLIYSWPNVSRCRVEEQLFGKAYQTSGFDNLVKVPINSRGLFAVEYLSFYEGTDNVCTQFSVTNAGNAWNLTSLADLEQMKLDYLKAVSGDVAARTTALKNLWKDDFSAKLASASPYADQQQALNLVAHGLLYLEKEVKDFKVGSPAGLYESAPLERPEVSFMSGGTELLKQNLAGFRDLFAGCNGEGLGYDDWLTEAGHGDLAADVLAATTDADNFVKTFPDLSIATPAELAELHVVIKKITDLLKTEMFGQGSPIGLTLPTSVEGDTD